MRRRAVLGLLVLSGVCGEPVAMGQMPSGHAPTGQDNPHAAAGAGGGQIPGMFVPPEDQEEPDAALPPGSIAVDLRDGDGKPVPGEQITLGILVNSVAKGESRKHQQATSDAQGRATFLGLDMASNIAYRVSAGYQGGLFAASPFQLQQVKAMRVTLHVYPVTRDIREAKVVTEAMLEAEVRDDRIQVQQLVSVYNLGRTAWQPEEVTMRLPAEFTAFSSQPSMNDQSVEVSGGNARLRGTFGPGKGSVEYRWQLPWSGESDVAFGVGLPPHVAITRVIMPASAGIVLAVEGFPPAETRSDSQGQKFFVTERQVRPSDAQFTSLSVAIHGLPSSGPGRLLATLLASCGVVAGLVLTFRRHRPSMGRDDADAYAPILDELVMLERSRQVGDVGPKTYERSRRLLIDELANLLAGPDQDRVKKLG